MIMISYEMPLITKNLSFFAQKSGENQYPSSHMNPIQPHKILKFTQCFLPVKNGKFRVGWLVLSKYLSAPTTKCRSSPAARNGRKATFSGRNNAPISTMTTTKTKRNEYWTDWKNEKYMLRGGGGTINRRRRQCVCAMRQCAMRPCRILSAHWKNWKKRKRFRHVRRRRTLAASTYEYSSIICIF